MKEVKRRRHHKPNYSVAARMDQSQWLSLRRTPLRIRRFAPAWKLWYQPECKELRFMLAWPGPRTL
jgi:hypothetical protein